MMSLSEDMLDGSHDSSGASNELSVSSYDRVIMPPGEAMFLHNSEHSANCSLVINSGVVDHSMEVVDKLHVSDQFVHTRLRKVDMTF